MLFILSHSQGDGLIINTGGSLAPREELHCGTCPQSVAGGLVILFGLVMAPKGPTYRLGTLMHMGPGFLPTALGVILIFLGILIAGAAFGVPPGEDEDILPAHPEWLDWACLLAGPLCFLLFHTSFQLLPATFTCVFVSALGDRNATLRAAA